MSRDSDLLCPCCKRPFSTVTSPPAVSRRAQRFCSDCQHQLPIDGCSFVECGKCSMQMLATQLDSHLSQCRGMGDGPHAALHATQGRRCSHRQHLVPVTELQDGCSTCRYCRMRRAQPSSSAVTMGQGPAKRARRSTTSAPAPAPAGTHAATAALTMATTPVLGHAASSSSGSSAVSPAHAPVSPPPLGWSAVTTEVGAPPRTPSPPLYFGRPLPTPFASAPLPPPPTPTTPTTPEPNPQPDLPTRDELDSLFGSLGSLPLGSAGSLGALAMGDQPVCSLLGLGTCPTQPSLSLGLPSMTWSLMHTASTAGLDRSGSRGSLPLPRRSSRALTSRPSWDKNTGPAGTPPPPPPPPPALYLPPPPPAFFWFAPPTPPGFVFLEEPLPLLEEEASLTSLWDALGWGEEGGEADGEDLLPATVTDWLSDVDSDDDDPLGSCFDLLHL